MVKTIIVIVDGGGGGEVMIRMVRSRASVGAPNVLFTNAICITNRNTIEIQCVEIEMKNKYNRNTIEVK